MIQPTDPTSTDTSRGAALRSWVRALDAMKIVEERPDATLPALFREAAEKFGDRVALIGVQETLTYRALAVRSDRYAHWAIAQGLAPGDVVCLMMPNCPDYVAIWFGISQVGCTVALLNTNLAGDALAHCIGAARPAHIVVAAAMLNTVVAVLPDNVRCWVHGHTDDARFPSIDIARDAVAPVGRPPAGRDCALLIYTSGTTGLPKAAKLSHARLVEWSCWFAAMMDVQPDDRLYDCLPMYHSTGGVVAIGAMLVKGGSVLIRERFSASRFWDDIVDGGCTIFQYIGELCRYLLHADPHPRETEHRLRLCCGNGLRGDVWTAFQQRFAIPHILEFYAATEGSVSLYNVEEKPGAIGRVPAFLAHRFPVALIRCDIETGAPARGADGFCIRVAADEPGEAIGRILDAGRRFDGYTDADASAGKVLRDVFAPGDRWFRTGDLMRRDGVGYYYFVDRLGDTFRWKSENVSTTDVAAVVAACPGIREAVVYGVAIPGHDGRAGMAAVTTMPGFSLDALQRHLAASLPGYARPLFVRICDSLAVTGTFKLLTGQLARDGYACDAVWFFDRAQDGFVACDDPLRAALDAGQVQRL
jgi:fatty-acyl-CoA synthase